MVKKLSAILLALFGSIFIMFGCGDPYKDLKLTVSTSEIILYLNEASSTSTEPETPTEPELGLAHGVTDEEIAATYPSEASFTVKLSGVGKGVSDNVNLVQYAYNGVENIVNIEHIEGSAGSDDGSRYKITASKPGNGILVVTSAEGGKREEIKVSVKVPVKSVVFNENAKAVRYLGNINLYNFLIYNPTKNDQKDMTFYIDDSTGVDVVTNGSGIIETSYAKIENGVLTSKESEFYPVDVDGTRYVKIYGVSNYNSNIVTQTIYLPVIEVIDESSIVVTANMENGPLDVAKIGNNYEIILGHNYPSNPFIYAREVIIKLNEEYTVDQKYVIKTNYSSTVTRSSVFQLDGDSISSEESRYSYASVKEGYPYKQFTFSQLNTGVDYLEVYIDRRGYEGLFTITLKFKITVKDFATELYATDEDNQSVIDKGITIYNAYGGTSLGSGVLVKLNPNPTNDYRIGLSLGDVPAAVGSGLTGVKMTLVNGNEVYSGQNVDSNTKIYLKHVYEHTQITEIISSGISPTLYITYTFTLSPTNSTEGYEGYLIAASIPLYFEAGVTDITVPTGGESIKINAVTGMAVGAGGGEEPAPAAVLKGSKNSFTNGLYEDPEDPGMDPGADPGADPEDPGAEPEEPAEPAYEIVLVTIEDQPADLAKLIKSVKAISVNGEKTDYNLIDGSYENPYFDIVFKEGLILNQFNRLVIEPKLQASQGTVTIELKTNNHITKTIIVEIFVPIVYTTATVEGVNVEIYNETSVGSFIYDTTKADYHVVQGEGLTVVAATEMTEEEKIANPTKYTTLNALTLSVDSRVGFNVYNYIILNDVLGVPQITRVNYNSNISISANRPYYTVDYETINGIKIPFITTGKLKTEAVPLELEIKIDGYDNNGVEVSIVKIIELTIIEPVTTIQISPISETVYTANSLGALKIDGSKIQYQLTVYPKNASSYDGTIIKYTYRNDILYTLTSDRSGMSYYIRVEHFLNLNQTTGELQAIVNTASLTAVLQAYRNDSLKTIDQDEIIKAIFENNVVVTVYASLKQYNKPELSSSTTVTLKNAIKVEKIIPSVDKNGVYFDLRKIDADYEGYEISFNVLPYEAYNKTLIVSIANESVVTIVSGIDKNNRITDGKIVIKPGHSAGRTYIRIAAEDSYELNQNGAPVPGSYLDISIRVADGTKEYPFEIRTAEEFMEIGEDIAAGYNSYYYVLTQTFSISAYEFAPFGTFNGGLSGVFSYEMAGIIYEQQNSLYGLTFNKQVTPETGNVYSYALFKELTATAEIEGLILTDVNYQLTISNPDFTDEINVGGIAGVNAGYIGNSSVNGVINVSADVKNINIGGIAGKNLTEYFIDFAGTDILIYTAGVITDDGVQDSNFTNNTENANVQINFVGSSAVTDATVNIGGVVGSVETYAGVIAPADAYEVGSYYFDPAVTIEGGVAVYQLYDFVEELNPTISNLVVASSIVSIDETSSLYKANIGGVAGYAHSSVFDNIVSTSVLRGHSNIGGIVGRAEYSVIANSAVEFANQGQTGEDSIAISGYTNVGGLVGYGTNVNIMFSYVRAYFNNRPVDNVNYFGNISLLENASIATKNIGGLIGYVDTAEVSAQWLALGVAGFKLDTLISAAENVLDYVYNLSANAIVKSYFNADINVGYTPLSGTINVGGFIGATATTGQVSGVDPVHITNSYVYGNICQAEPTVYEFVNRCEIDPADYTNIGTYTTFVIGDLPELVTSYYNFNLTSVLETGNKLLEIIINYTNEIATEGEGVDARQYQIQNYKIKVHPNKGKLVGNQEYQLSSAVLNVIDTNTEGVVTTTIQTSTSTLQGKLPLDVKLENVYYAIGEEKGIVEVAQNTTFIDVCEVISNETIIENTSALRLEKNNNITYGYKDLTDLNTYVNFGNVIEASLDNVEFYPNKTWVKCDELNSGYPVLFARKHEGGEILFKVLPTEIRINVADNSLLDFTNLSYVQDGENIVLFYNRLISGRSYSYVNYYKLVTAGEPDLTTEPVTALEVNLDIVDLYTKYGIVANYDKNMVITSSNPNIVSVQGGNLIKTNGVGKVTLTVASRLDVSIYDTIEILVVEGLSDFALFKTKNLTTNKNKLVTINKADIVDESSPSAYSGAITQVIDKTSNYALDTVNEDSLSLTDCNGAYARNTNLGVMMEVSAVGNGEATLNGANLEKGVTYLFRSISDFSFRGTYKGLLYITVTPFIVSTDANFGTTLNQTTSKPMSINNCILINQLTKTYKFNVVPKAESIEVVDKSKANLDPTKYVDITISTITSDFVQSGESYTVNETINATITDLTTGKNVGAFVLDMATQGTNSSFVTVELLEEYSLPTSDVLKIEYVKKLRIRFDADKYKDRTSGVTFNLKDIKYEFNFYPTSNANIVAVFNLEVVPRLTTNIETAYYPNSEISSTGGFYPQESESEYIVPSRAGLLKIELQPDFNNTEYVEVTVDENMKKHVSFTQQLAIMASDENSYVTGYRTTLQQAANLPNFAGVRLRNESVMVNGTSIYYTGNYYLQVFLSEKAPINSKIEFTITGYRTENGEVIKTKVSTLTLTVQPLPSITLTYKGAQEGLIAKGTVAELEVVASNFEGEVQLVSSCLSGDVQNISQPVYDAEKDKWYVEIGINAEAGDTAIIRATASRYLNGVLEERTSTVKLFIVEYIIEGARLEGSTYVNGGYQFEVLNGTQTPLNVVFDVTKGEGNEAVDSLLTNLQQLASGKVKPLGVDSYINNWWQVENGIFTNALYSNALYGNYRFVDTNKADLNRSHFFALESIVVSRNNVIGYRMQYFYNEIGVPTLFIGDSYGNQVYELEFTFTFVIKDNSTYDHPNPIKNVTEFMALGGLTLKGEQTEMGAVTEGHYILIADLVLDDYYPFAAQFDTLDGNGHIIKINSINTEKYKQGGTANVGLFETVSEKTVLKNITIDISPMLVTTQMANNTLNGVEGTTAYIDLAGVESFNFGFVTAENNGSITNAKVINSKPTVMLDNAPKHVLINSTIGYLNEGLVDATIGGIAGVNNGTISNSYVGLNAANYTNGVSSTEYRSNSEAGFTEFQTYPFNITAGKSVAALVNTNTGIVANNYVLGVGVINTATIMEGAKTAGFVVNNTSTGVIFNGMVEGLETNNYRASNTVYIEGKGYIGGFVYTNAGKISNAYSNIYITTNSGGSGGFVYINETGGQIINAYSTVSSANQSLAHGQFTGINDKDQYNNNGELTSCYYLVLEGEIENANEPATGIIGKKIVGDGAVDPDDEENNDNPFRDTGSFNGFNFASGNDTNNIWQISQTSLHLGPRLISASGMKTFSHRVLMHTTVDENTQETVYNYMYDSDCFYGSNLNPLLVNTADEFVRFIINNSKSITLNGETITVFGITTQTNTATNMPYYVRLINDLDFSSITLNNYYVDSKLLSEVTFAGVLDGNGMEMKGVRLVDQNQSSDHENYGLFYQVGLKPEQVADPNFGSNNTVTSAIMNVNMTIKGVDAGRAYKVGTIAGSVYDSALINITINGDNLEGNGENKNAFVRGRNIVGGIAGLIKNSQDKLITNITINNVSATAAYSSANITDVTRVDSYGKPYNTAGGYINFSSYFKGGALATLSYAGAVAGIVDNNNRRAEDYGANIKTSLNGSESITLVSNVVNYPSGEGTVSTSAGDSVTAVEEINIHRTKPANNIVSKIIVQNGGYISAEHAGGIFGYVGEHTHVKNSKYLLGEIKSKSGNGTVFRQEIVGQNYAGALVGENYGMLEQVSVEYASDYFADVEAAFGTGATVNGEVKELFGTNPVVAIGGIAGFSAGSIILDSYSNADVVNPKAKIAGGLVGLTAGSNYFSHIIVTGNVYAAYRVGGLIGVYDSLFVHDFNKNLQEPANQDYDGDGVKGEASVYKPGRLLLDYTFALNEWSGDIETLLYDNLKAYYLNTATGSDYYNFEIRFPEVGNQLMKSATSLKYDTVYAGSLIGFVNTGTTAANYTTTPYDDFHSVDTINKVVAKARRTQVVNNGGGSTYLFSTVISTTLNSAKITTNEKIHGYMTGTNSVVADNEDYIQQVTGETGAGGIGDKLDFVNGIGNQFKIDVVLGTTKSNATMFNMFIWDTLTMSSSDSASLAKAGSQVWRLGDKFPKYIIGIYSNYNKMASSEDIYNSIIKSNDTRNQFYLLENGTYTIGEDIVGKGSFSNVFRNVFEGTIIGVVSEGKNPRIVLEVRPGDKLTTFFNELNTSSIMNVDFEIVYKTTPGNTQKLELSNVDGLTTQTKYNGFFAKYVNSSVLSNVNFYFNIKTDTDILYDTDGGVGYEAIGLMVGYLKDSTMQGVNVLVNNLDPAVATDMKTTVALKKYNHTTNTSTQTVSFGGLVGYASKSTLNKVGIYSYNNTIISVYSNDSTINFGNIVANANNVDLSDINLENGTILGNTTLIKTTNNNIYEVAYTKSAGSVNFGGLVGYATNSAISTSYFMGDIAYGQSYTLHTKLNLGGVLGYGANTAIEHTNVNEYMQLTSAGGIKRSLIQKAVWNAGLAKDVYVNHEFKVKNGDSTKTTTSLTTNVGAVLGYGVNLSIKGSSTSGLNVSSNTDIVVEGPSTVLSVGGVIGYIKNNETVVVAKVANTGKVKVTTTTAATSTAVTVGGMVGRAIGGTYTMLYNLGDVTVKTENTYSVGAILGVSETNSSQSVLKLSKFVNYADVYYDGESVPKASSNRFIGGVAGSIVNSGSQFEGGYTLARVYWMKNGSTRDENSQFPINNKDNGGVNGIGFVGSISESTFNRVFFVYDFLPYSTYSNSSAQTFGAKTIVTTSTSTTDRIFGGIEYVELVQVLNKHLGGYFDTDTSATEFVTEKTGGTTEVTKLNLPHSFKNSTNIEASMFSALELIKQTNDITYPNSARKLNPKKITTAAETHEISADGYYIMSASAVNGKTVKLESGTSFKGLLTCKRSETDYPVIMLTGITNNYGCISNFAVRYVNNVTYVNEKGVLLQNNYGNISNCVTYGFIDVSSLTLTKDVATFVYNNHGNILQSGSAVLFVVESLSLTDNSKGNNFSGFVNENTGFIKDCYSTTSIIDDTVGGTATFSNSKGSITGKVAGFVIKNSGVIETSYYAGTLGLTKISSNVFANENTSSGILRNCYYDIEATPVTSGGTNINGSDLVNATDSTSVRFLRTADILLEDGTAGVRQFYNTALKTANIPSAFKVTYSDNDAGVMFGYSGIKGGIQLPTMFYITTSTSENITASSYAETVSHSINSDGAFKSLSTTTSNKMAYGIFHIGQFNNLGTYQKANKDFFMMTNLNFANVNHTAGNHGQLDNMISLKKHFYGFGHKIENLKISSGNDYIGLFAKVESTGKVENLVISSTTVTSSSTKTTSAAGTVAGVNDGGTINKITINTTTLTGSSAGQIGGAVGKNTGAITFVNVNTPTITGKFNLGGIVGSATNGLIKFCEIDKVTVTGTENNLGGAVGSSIPGSGSVVSIIGVKVKGDSKITNSKTVDLTSIRSGISNTWTENITNKVTAYNGESNSLNTGGLVGQMAKNTTLAASKVEKVTVKAETTAGGLVGRNDSGATITYKDGSYLYTISSFTATDASKIVVEGKANLGGLVGLNKGTITGASTKTTVYAKVGTSRTSDMYDSAIGGVAGSNWNGTISNVGVVSSTLYGSRLVGGIVGYVSGGTVTYNAFNSSTINYQSEYDMDEDIGYMGTNLKLGIGSSGASWSSNNFNNYFGLGGKSGTSIFDGLSGSADFVIEYGGIETKLGSNTSIRGKQAFSFYVAFILGANVGGTHSDTNTSTSSSIKGIYDTYHNYVVDMTDHKDAGQNHSRLNRWIDKYKRTFDIPSTSTQFNIGNSSYKKYTSTFNDYNGDTYMYGYYLDSETAKAAKAGTDTLKYLYETSYQTIWNSYYNYYMNNVSYNTSSATNYANTNADKTPCKKLKDASYPGMTWSSAVYVERVKSLGEKTYYGKDKWFAELPWGMWKNVGFEDMDHGGDN